jgi:hypothetical protein
MSSCFETSPRIEELPESCEWDDSSNRVCKTSRTNSRITKFFRAIIKFGARNALNFVACLFQKPCLKQGTQTAKARIQVG